MKKFAIFVAVFAVALGAFVVYNNIDEGNAVTSELPANVETDANTRSPFIFLWSEYPSWSAFDVASEYGLIDGEAGKQGEIEIKYNVDIVLKQMDYETCLTVYGNGQADAYCVTNMDSLAPSLRVPSVAILPTSTSVGADALIVTNNVSDFESLKNHTVYGLENSVSHFAFYRILESNNLDPKDYTFTNMDPAVAAQAVQTLQENIDAILVWNPFSLQTLRTVEGSKVLDSSASFPGEIIDQVVVSQAALNREGGDDFAKAICETYYRVAAMALTDSDETVRNRTVTAIGAKFSSLGLEDMKIVLEQTDFYETPVLGIELYTSENFQKNVTPSVTQFCVDKNIVPSTPSVTFGKENADYRFTTEYMEAVSN